MALVRTTGTPDPANLTAPDFVFAPAENRVLLGTDGNDSLTGRSGDDLFDGGLGRDLYTGNAGADTFVLGNGDADAVLDFENGADVLDVSPWGVGSIDELLIADVCNRRMVVSAGENAATIRSEAPDSAAADLTAVDFLFGAASPELRPPSRPPADPPRAFAVRPAFSKRTARLPLPRHPPGEVVRRLSVPGSGPGTPGLAPALGAAECSASGAGQALARSQWATGVK